MKKEMIDYILRNYSHFLNKEESKVLNKMHDYFNLVYYESIHGKDEMKDKLHLFELDEKWVQFFEEHPRDEIRMNIAQNIMHRHENEMIYNTCSVCGGIARTLNGRQCRNGHRW